MKHLTLIAILTLTAVFSFAGPVRDFTLPDIDDQNVSLSDYMGDYIIILDFWASWCAPCMRLMPELEKIHSDYEDIKVIGISIDNPRSINRAKTLVRSQKYTMVSLFDPEQEIMDRFQVTSVPHTFIIGYDGEIIYEHTGYNRGDEEEFLEVINQYKASQEAGQAQEDNE